MVAGIQRHQLRCQASTGEGAIGRGKTQRRALRFKDVILERRDQPANQRAYNRVANGVDDQPRAELALQSTIGKRLTYAQWTRKCVKHCSCVSKDFTADGK